MSDTNEQLYFDTLKRIARAYMTTEQLQRRAEKMYGVSYYEALEMSYDNIQGAAADAIRGKRRPQARRKKFIGEDDGKPRTNTDYGTVQP